MELAGFPVQADSVPVEHSVGGVAVLLDLEDDEAFADGVESAAGDEEAVAGLGFDDVDDVGDGSVSQCLFERWTIRAFPESDVELGPGIGVGDEPHFGFGFAPELGRDGLGWVDLDGQVLAGVEDLHQQGEGG